MSYELTRQAMMRFLTKEKPVDERKDTMIELRNNGKKLREIAPLYGITPERVRQIING